ncbi:MAG: transposase, partial [Planctomycetaceae bacterium]
MGSEREIEIREKLARFWLAAAPAVRAHVLPRHKAANWVGPGRGRKSTRPDASGVVELSPFEFLDRLADLVPPPRKHRHRYHGVFAP